MPLPCVRHVHLVKCQKCATSTSSVSRFPSPDNDCAYNCASLDPCLARVFLHSEQCIWTDIFDVCPLVVFVVSTMARLSTLGSTCCISTKVACTRCQTAALLRFLPRAFRVMSSSMLPASRRPVLYPDVFLKLILSLGCCCPCHF